MSKKLETTALVRSDASFLVRAAAATSSSDAAELVLMTGGTTFALGGLVLSIALADAGWYLAAAAVVAVVVAAATVVVAAAVQARDPGRVLRARSMASRFGYGQLRGEIVGLDGVKTWETLCSLARHIVDVCPERHSEVRNLLFETGLLLRDAVKCDDLRRQAVRDGDGATAALWSQRTSAAVSAVESVRSQMSAMLAEFATSDQASRIAAGADRLEAMSAATLELHAS